MRISALSLILITSLCNSAQAADWFDNNDTLTQVHKHLLDDDLPGMFESLVEVWQNSPKQVKEDHLNELFTQALDRDCGKSLSKPVLPSWISSLIIKRLAIQSPGRDSYRLVVDAEVESIIENIELSKWVDKPISSDSLFSKQNSKEPSQTTHSYRKRYNLNSPLDSGLYRLTVTSQNNQTWSSWIILGEVRLKQQVRWASKDTWRIDKKELLNPYCPLPRLDVGLFDYINGQYEEVWGKSYESDYPTTLEGGNISNDRYVLAISMVHSRWQGDIAIERTQTISKTFDISGSEELK
mgnify:FL=1